MAKSVTQDSSKYFKAVSEEDMLKADNYQLVTNDVAQLQQNFNNIVAKAIDDLLYTGNKALINQTISELVKDQNVKNQVGPKLLAQLPNAILNGLKRHNRK